MQSRKGKIRAKFENQTRKIIRMLILINIFTNHL